MSIEMTVSQATYLSPPRDLRLDFFRGLALFCIFIDHIPNNAASAFTIQALGMADAAEVFILIAGYAAGMVYGRHFLGGITAAGVARIYNRVWQLYVAHIFMFVIFLATVARTVAVSNSSLYAEELRAADFLREPDIAIAKALTLQFQPQLMDILPLYIVLLALLPLVLWGFRHVPGLTIAASAILWLAVQATDSLTLPAYPGPELVWPFNPFAWQALFFLSAYFGWRGARGAIGVFHRRWLLGGAVAVAVFCFWLRNYVTFHDAYDSLTSRLVAGLWPYMDKPELSPVRFANVLAWGLIVARLVPPQAPILSGWLARPFVLCGRHSLHVFCLGILLSVIGHFIINEMYGGVGLQLAISLGGVVIMVGVAALREWFAEVSQRRPQAPGAAKQTEAVR